ncbi:MAG TPA: peptide chain release factor 1, partial [Thermodesulfobacteriota bacterium]|nr:peptide chain release factor 1 [Thermodesulfobacteriota bacterium]
YKKVRKQIEDNKELLDGSDEEIKELAKAEMPVLKEELESLEKKLKLLLLPMDPRDEKNVLLEIRAGTGGEEASLFAADLFRMYARYAENNRWKVEIMSQSPTGLGGFKEIIALIAGKGVYSRLKYEGGVHRVQRVPATESQGRIHTSAVTVAILPEAEDVEVEIKPDELRIDVYRSSGPGGQSVNTTDSAVRVTHIPSGLVVTCQDEKSQHKNKAKALKILRSRLLDQAIQEQQEEIAKTRKNMVGSGDRSERIRTYNYPQNRVSDHRIGLTLHRLEQVMEGAVDEIIDALSTHFQAEALKEGWSNSVEKIS